MYVLVFTRSVSWFILWQFHAYIYTYIMHFNHIYPPHFFLLLPPHALIESLLLPSRSPFTCLFLCVTNWVWPGMLTAAGVEDYLPEHRQLIHIHMTEEMTPSPPATISCHSPSGRSEASGAHAPFVMECWWSQSCACQSAHIRVHVNLHTQRLQKTCGNWVFPSTS